ncbi:hypothetical protein F0562_029462 [Nyssa sinensis]|uniref:Uncharacterized protein n=1 Tax=Nyssa sinensis TaxID=561372 RepID=A0A5J5B373_9ASTE|nr:hypothetical protein F0562_029462 [Nyssa sinensis]
MGSIVGGVIEEFDSHMGLLVLQTGWKGYSWKMQTGVRVGCVAATGVAIGGDDDAVVGIYVYIRVGVACRSFVNGCGDDSIEPESGGGNSGMPISSLRLQDMYMDGCCSQLGIGFLVRSRLEMDSPVSNTLLAIYVKYRCLSDVQTICCSTTSLIR